MIVFGEKDLDATLLGRSQGSWITFIKIWKITFVLCHAELKVNVLVSKDISTSVWNKMRERDLRSKITTFKPSAEKHMLVVNLWFT